MLHGVQSQGLQSEPVSSTSTSPYQQPSVNFESAPNLKTYHLRQNFKLEDCSHGSPNHPSYGSLSSSKMFLNFQSDSFAKLQQIHLHKIPIVFYLSYFYKFLINAGGPKPTELIPTKNTIHFDDFYKLQVLRICISEYIETTGRFRLKIDDCVCHSRSQTNNKSALALVMAFSSNIYMETIIGTLHDNFCKRSSIELISSSGKLKQINIGGVLIGKSCEDNLRLCVAWNWLNVSFLNWSELILQCNQNCQNCSSLLFLVGLRKHMTSTFAITNVTFGGQRFFPAKFHALSRAMNALEPPEGSFIHTVLIKIRGLELFFGQQASFSYNPDVMTQSFDQLECFNITFQNVTFHVEVDSSGWGFLRKNLNPSPVRVRFSNEVSIEWCSYSTKTTRLVAMETYSIPQSVINNLCASRGVKPCLMSPLLFIDQDFDVPFLKAVKVQMPLPINGEVKHFDSNYKLKVFSKNSIFKKQWYEITSKSLELLQNSFIYRSTTFSPVVPMNVHDGRSINASDIVENYRPIYLTVQPLKEREKVRFDCRRISNEEREELIKIKENEIKAFDIMRRSDTLHGKITGNLEIDMRYGYLLDDGKLVFRYPDTIHFSNAGNDQTYIMRQIDENLYPEATITYFISNGETNSDQKSFQLSVQILKTKSQSGGTVTGSNKLDFKALENILEVSKQSWGELLEHLSVSGATISDIQDHNSQDALLNLESE